MSTQGKFVCFEVEDTGAESRPWQEARARGLVHFRAGQLDPAEQHLQNALRLAEGFGDSDPRLARSLAELAELRRVQGDAVEAEQLVCRSLDIFQERGEHFHPNIVPSLNNLAGLYYSQGNHAKALALYSRALQIWDETHQPPHGRIVPVLFNLATLHRDQNDANRALALLARACEMADRVWGREHPDSQRCRRAYQDLLLASGERRPRSS